MNEPTLLTCGICGEKSRPIHSVMDCIDELRAQVAAAEERGRRRGIEETVKRAIQLFPDTAHDNNGWIREFITALAPRDSAPSRGHPADCLCVGCVLDESKAPRDSGKGSDCEIVGCQIIGKHEHPIGGPHEVRK